MCYFDGIIKFEDFDLDDILIDEKSYRNILVYNTSYKTVIGADSLPLEKTSTFHNVIILIKSVINSNYCNIFLEKC